MAEALCKGNLDAEQRHFFSLHFQQALAPPIFLAIQKYLREYDAFPNFSSQLN